ncbi:unnamed protein product, partial [Ectocarpus sp. 12 AP-2014]
MFLPLPGASLSESTGSYYRVPKMEARWFAADVRGHGAAIPIVAHNRVASSAARGPNRPRRQQRQEDPGSLLDKKRPGLFACPTGVDVR